MTDQNETATIEQIEAALAEATATQKTALKAFEKARADSSVDVIALIEASDAVKAAGAAVSRAENNVKAAKFAQYAEERNGLMQTLHDDVAASIDTDRLVAVGVETIVIKVDLTGDNAGTVTITPSGAALKAPRAKGTGTGNGFKSTGGIRVNGVDYRSTNAAYITLRAAEDGCEPSEVTPANKESAMRWLSKPERGYAIEEIAPTA